MLCSKVDELLTGLGIRRLVAEKPLDCEENVAFGALEPNTEEWRPDDEVDPTISDVGFETLVKTEPSVNPDTADELLFALVE